ncbi:MAG: HD domain-containing protein [Clostridia bacterium]|nr:HD domain-containing protein [Clostridia bacterium]MDD4387002.1 HD domain-containing protein [Clostridia bacterium]
MITCDQIKNDPYIVDIYNEIERNSIKELWATHGWSHILKVINTVETVLKQLKFNEEIIECGKIAALLHDVGCIKGKDNHEIESYNIANKYLSDKDISDEYKKMILDAIIDHSEGENISSIVGATLIFADKIDYDKNRLTPIGYQIENFNQIQYIDYIDVMLCDNNLTVKFIVSNMFDKSSMEKYYFTPKVFKAIYNFSAYLKLKPCIKLNNDEWKLY